MKQQDIVEFYDEFIEEQKRSGINDRIYSLYKKLLKLGLRNNSKVLELGCGIGTMTWLLSRRVNMGYIEAIDLSPQSIAFAKQKLQKKNIRFAVADVVHYKPGRPEFDFITLFDVIEHIPLEQHNTLFQNIRGICNAKTLVVINIPSPGSVEYDRQYQPHLLQLIDQPVYLEFLNNNLVQSGLELILFESYSVWNENDYHFFVARKKSPFVEISLAGKRTFLQKALKKAQRIWVKRLYNYPGS